jgi:short-subunit dehydrogenase
MAVYAASKAFVFSFTEALRAENRSTGNRVLALCPGSTATRFFEAAGKELLTRGRQHPSKLPKSTCSLRSAFAAEIDSVCTKSV